MAKNVQVIGTGIAAMIMLMAMLCAGEVWLRLYQWLKADVPLFEVTGKRMGNLSPITIDDALGWRATEYYRDETIEKTAGGKEYLVSRSQNEYGFRMFGNLRSGRPRIWVIGDSFTHAPQVSDHRTYYAFLTDALGAEVFAYGVGGYGTLQEYMIVDRFKELIEPDLIVWQFCTNDFINNDPDLETASMINNNGMRRPYWIDGKVSYVLPKDSWELTREFANRYSRFLYFIIGRLDKLHALYAQTVETQIEKDGFTHRGFLHSVEVTDALMARVRDRVGSVPIVAFSCGSVQPYTDAFKKISSSHGIVFLDEVAESIQVARECGEDVLAADRGHWNERGHRLVGEVIANRIKEMVPHLVKRIGPDKMTTVRTH